jgi:gephyrin
MESGTLKVALLIVSTTAAKDPSTDASAAVLGDVFKNEGGGKWKVTETKIVADVATQIQRQIMLWADIADGVNLIITTGGTGFAESDFTPEVNIFEYSADVNEYSN